MTHWPHSVCWRHSVHWLATAPHLSGCLSLPSAKPYYLANTKNHNMLIYQFAQWALWAAIALSPHAWIVISVNSTLISVNSWMNGTISYQLRLRKDQQIVSGWTKWEQHRRRALKEMKRHKAPGLSGLVTEVIQATGEIGTQWMLDLCNGIVKEGSIPEDCQSTKA